MLFATILVPDLPSRLPTDPAKANPFLNVLATLSLVPLEAFALHLFGTTPGKALFGIRLSTAEGERISLVQSFSRALRVWVLGMGIGFPVLSLFAQIAGYFRLASRGRTVWDESLGIEVEYREITPGRGMAIAAFFLVILFVLGSAMSGMAPTP
jgi:uncharacterized RDD family membrane protein YckC